MVAHDWYITLKYMYIYVLIQVNTLCSDYLCCLSCGVTKQVFGVSDEAKNKLGYTVTGKGKKLEVSDCKKKEEGIYYA